MKTIWTYENMLPNVGRDNQISLGEGGTPLVRSRNIGNEIGLPNLFFKLENLNPTGSYKDRFAAVFVSKLKAKGQKLCVATSSGNTGAALAAYCAASGIRCLIFAVDGAPDTKISQMQLYGAKVYSVEGFGIDSLVTENVFSLLHQFTSECNIPLPISAYCYCPEGMQGVETIGYEILDSFNGEEVQIFSPSGGGGLTLSTAKAVMANNQKFGSGSTVHCVQPIGNNTIAGALRNRSTQATRILGSTTKVSGLQVPNILDGNDTLQHCIKVGGNGFLVEDNDVFGAQYKLATMEGIFCEPAGAVALAGVISAVKNQEISANDNIICLVTGSGFKDLSNLQSTFQLSTAIRLANINGLSKIIENLK